MSEIYDDDVPSAGPVRRPAYMDWHVWAVPLEDDPHTQRIVTMSLPLDLTAEEAQRLITFLGSFQNSL